jgi:hypothetical protein
LAEAAASETRAKADAKRGAGPDQAAAPSAPAANSGQSAFAPLPEFKSAARAPAAKTKSVLVDDFVSRPWWPTLDQLLQHCSTRDTVMKYRDLPWFKDW